MNGLLKSLLKLIKFYTEGQYFVTFTLSQSETLSWFWAKWLSPAHLKSVPVDDGL